MEKCINDYLFIVWGGERYNPLGVIRSLGEIGIHPVVIINKTNVRIASRSKYIKSVYFVDTLNEGLDLLLDLYDKSRRKAFIITTDDRVTSFLDINYEKLKDSFLFFNAGKEGRITEFMNKDAINRLALKHGLKVLKTHVVSKGEVPKDISYPIITKSIASIQGGWKDDVFVCNNDIELQAAYEKIKSDTILLQKYIKKKNELCLDGCVVNRGKETLISIASNYNYILPSAYSCYLTLFELNNKNIENSIKSMMEEIGFEGIFSAEFLVDQNDELYFLEINFRNSTWSYASTCLGMNLPVIWSNGILNKSMPINIKHSIPNGYTAMVEPSDFKARVLGKRCSIFRWLKDLINCGCLFYFNIKDIKPFFAMVISILTRK